MYGVKSVKCYRFWRTAASHPIPPPSALCSCLFLSKLLVQLVILIWIKYFAFVFFNLSKRLNSTTIIQRVWTLVSLVHLQIQCYSLSHLAKKSLRSVQKDSWTTFLKVSFQRDRELLITTLHVLLPTVPTCTAISSKPTVPNLFMRISWVWGLYLLPTASQISFLFSLSLISGGSETG